MADQLPPALLAMVDQGMVAVAASLDTSVHTVRGLLKTQSRELTLAEVTGEFALKGVQPHVACLLALAVLRLAEAEEQHGG